MSRAAAALLALAATTAGCDSGGTCGAACADAQSDDATASDATGGDDSSAASDASDAGADVSGFCSDYDAARAPSDDCVVLGACPEDCLSGTATAYACATPSASVGTYPSRFHPPVDPLVVVAFGSSGVYPWDAAAFVSCAAQTCVRWANADHRDGGSAWAGDPCAANDAGARQAWTCPSYQGFLPPVGGCVNAGDGQRIGGAGTGMPVDVVWCCPAVAADGGSDAGGEAGSDAGVDAGAGDAADAASD